MTRVHFPLGDFLGLDIQVPEKGRGTAEVDIGEPHRNPNGVAHGGVLFTMVDTAMGAATMSVLDYGAGDRCATIDIQLRFIRPVAEGLVRAEASVVHLGGRVVQLEAIVRETGGQLVATASGAFVALRAGNADERQLRD
jgi:acyl-CoA thioesterase